MRGNDPLQHSPQELNRARSAQMKRRHRRASLPRFAAPRRWP